MEFSATTDANGAFDVLFDISIDKVMATVNSPQSGQDVGLIGCSSLVTGDKKATVRVWRSGASYTTKPATNEQVTVTLVGILG
jgi:hypothetical protein